MRILIAWNSFSCFFNHEREKTYAFIFRGLWHTLMRLNSFVRMVPPFLMICFFHSFLAIFCVVRPSRHENYHYSPQTWELSLRSWKIDNKLYRYKFWEFYIGYRSHWVFWVVAPYGLVSFGLACCLYLQSWILLLQELAHLCRQVVLRTKWGKGKERNSICARGKDGYENGPLKGTFWSSQVGNRGLSNYILLSGIRYCLQEDNWLLCGKKGSDTINHFKHHSGPFWVLDLLPAVNVLRVLCTLQSLFLNITLDSHCDTQSLTFHVFVLIMIIKCEIRYYGRTALLETLLILPLTSMLSASSAFVCTWYSIEN
jgi:hypothetical protein